MLFDTELLNNSEKILHNKLNTSRYQPERCKVLTSSIVRKPYSRGRGGIMAVCKGADTERCLLATQKLEKYICYFELQIPSSKNLSSNGATAVHQTGRTSRCASSKKIFSLQRRAMDLLLQLRLAFRCAIGTSFTLGCVASPDNALRWHICIYLTGAMYSSTRLPVSDSRSSAKIFALIEVFRKTIVVK